jgi:D-lactate dehydrogenase (cytochrome)
MDAVVSTPARSHAPTVARRSPSPELLALLQRRFAERCSTSQAVLLQHGTDESAYQPQPPDAVVFVHGTDEVAFVVRACARERVPVIGFGVGSSVEGHLLAVQGGVCIDFSQMNKVLAIRPGDLTATVEAGVTRGQLNTALAGDGLLLLGRPRGRRLHRRHGRHGRLGHQHRSLRHHARQPREPHGGHGQGDVVRTASQARKSSAGYNLTQLYCGSEGTLGLITEATVRLHPHPEAYAAAVVHFPSVRAAVDCVTEAIQMGVPLARAEMLDALTIRAVNAHSRTALSENPTLFLEFGASQAQIDEQADVVREIVANHGGGAFQWAIRQEERSRLWTPRHHAYFACLQLKAGSRSLTTDACVPLSALAPASTRPRRTSPRTACSRRCSAMWATATSTAWCWSTRNSPKRTMPPRPSATGWCSARCAMAAPRPASTAWGCTR